MHRSHLVLFYNESAKQAEQELARKIVRRSSIGVGVGVVAAAAAAVAAALRIIILAVSSSSTLLGTSSRRTCYGISVLILVAVLGVHGGGGGARGCITHHGGGA